MHSFNTVLFFFCITSCVFSLSNLSQETTNVSSRALAQPQKLTQKMEAQQEQMRDIITNLAQTISNSSSKKEAQRELLAQSEGMLDKLKILFLDLALKIVQAVS